MLWPSIANAQYSVPSQASQTESQRAVEVSESSDGMTMILPEEKKKIPWEMGVSLNFITSEPSLGDKSLVFTDLMLLRLHTLVALGTFELFAGSDILPKQPSYTDELVWQGSLAGVRTTFGSDISAWARGQVGPQLGKNGQWYSGDAAVEHHYALQKMLFVDSSLGWSHTQLVYKDDTANASYTDELFTRVGLSFRDPRKGLFAAWANVDYYLPIVHDAGLDPQPRVNMRLGALGAVTRNVDLFIEYSILDRGDLEDPATTLPALGGGFDQNTLILGFMRHFGPKRSFYND